MSSIITRGGGIGRNAYTHTLPSSGDELETRNGRRGRFGPRRKMSKIIKLARSQNQNIRRQARVRSPGESDSSEDEVNGAEGESIEIPDDSEDEDGKTNSIAPSGAAIMKNKFRNRVSKRSLPKSISSGSVKRQAGRTGRNDRKISPSLKQRAAGTSHRQKQHIQRLSPLNKSKDPLSEDHSSTPSSPRRSRLPQKDDQDASSGDEIYELLDLMTDSDEDDVDVEMLEEAALIEDVAASGDLGFPMFAEGDSMFPRDDDASGYRSINHDDYSDYLPFSDIGYETSMYDPTTREQTAGAEDTVDRGLTPKDTDVDMEKDPLLDNTSDIGPVVSTSSPIKDIVSPELEELRRQTGLCTPSSLKQPLDLSNCDPEETEEDEPDHQNIISVSALKRRSSHASTSRVLSSGIRKKPKKPKVANWTISRNELCMSHSKKGKLVISGGSKAKKSGLNTPRGIMPVDPKKLTAFDLGLSNLTQKFTQSASALQSFESVSLCDAEQGNPLLSATGELSGPLFSSVARDTPQESVDTGVSTHETFYFEQPAVEEDISRYVDFLTEDL